MNYKSYNLGDWIGLISSSIEDERELDGNEMRDLLEFLTKLPRIPDNATNGDMVKLIQNIFPCVDIYEHYKDDVTFEIDWYEIGIGEHLDFAIDKDWWNAPYKKEGDRE